MSTDAHLLMSVYKGWDGYQVGLVHAIAPLSREQLAWRGSPHLRSVGELAAHIVKEHIGHVAAESFSDNDARRRDPLAIPGQGIGRNQPAALSKAVASFREVTSWINQA